MTNMRSAYQDTILVHPTRRQKFCWQNRRYFHQHLRPSPINFSGFKVPLVGLKGVQMVEKGVKVDKI